MKTYRIIDNVSPKSAWQDYPRISITEAGALIIWAAYEKLFGNICQTMERREERGGICYMSEIDYFKKEGALSKEFDYKQYVA